jgi:flagellar hook-length control protein FliK
MSLLPPALSSPTPASAPSSGASCAASTRGDETSQGDSESFGDVLSRSLAASGESPAKPGGKPVASVPVKRLADEKTDAAEVINTAALLFVPLETRIARAASADSGTAAPAPTGATASTLSATPSAELPADPAASTAATATAASDATLAGDADTQAPQTLFASGLPAAPTKGRESSEPTAPSATGDETAITLPAGKMSLPAGATHEGQSEPSSGHEQRPGAEAHEILGTDTRAEQNPVAAKAVATTTTKDAPDEAAGNAAPVSAPGTSHHEAGTPAATPGITLSATAPTVHASAAPASPAAAAAPNQAALSPEVGSGEWGQALGRQMLHMGKAGEPVAELQLNPPGLGPLKVTLSLHDNQVQAFFVSAHSSVRAAVEAALPQLRSTLADNGISLGNTSVDSGSQQQPAFAQGQQGQNGQAQSGPSGQRSQAGYLAADAASVTPAAVAPAPRRGKVDTYA